ncbi:hypothetical protein FEM48_Zijuj08G0186200 [Ziziphus jujuba var. spinosa]|uniref:Uncharacterized protein n=1 Tax=Ziziphus jujuba var. spinosa TaxID=714518 RepID=A0A978V0Q1_ZIZJJ|nr:hypothetical protein FEM48_Zijuj08G0186200 [Ziziphus jujuba var. spinosa]
MPSLQPIHRFCNATIVLASSDHRAAISNHILSTKRLEEPTLLKLKAERDLEKLFQLFNRIVIENSFAFEDTVSRLAKLLSLSMLHLVLTLTRDLGAIEAFLKEVPSKFDIELDVFSINIVIKAYCEMGILDKAY